MDLYTVGQIINSGVYQIRVDEPLSQNIAYSYKATNLQTGDTVLFKSYGDTVPNLELCPWFNDFVTHQTDISKRLSTIPDQAIQILGHFNHQGTYHQIIQWAHGCSLDRLLEKEFNKATSLEKHLHLAKVMMFSLRKVHELGIIHRDQKPANFFAEERPELLMKYKVMMADFDMSLINGRPSLKPNDHVGTFGYFSPEYYRGKPAVQASDVFTVGGLMLYELFAGVHPLEALTQNIESETEGHILIKRAIEARRIPKMDEVAPQRAAQVPAQVLELINLALDPEPARRPTAADIHSALITNRLVKTLVLKGGPAGLKWRMKEVSSLSRSMCERFFGTAVGAVSSDQGRFDPSEDRAEWYYTHREGALNASMLNGKAIHGRVTLEPGMKLQVGNPDSGNIALEMEVSFE